MSENNSLKGNNTLARHSGTARLIIVILLILGCLLAIRPLARPELAAGRTSAVPAPTPLDKEGADALIEQLKATLADSIEDEDAVASIGTKWDARILAGKTKKQVINLLFADLKSIVTEKETQDAVWASWSEIVAEADSDEPVAPPVVTPKAPGPQAPPPRPRSGSVDDPTEVGFDVPRIGGRWVLTDDLKRSNAGSEMAFFRTAYQAVKVWRPEPRQYRGQRYTIYVATDPLDPNAQGKMVGIDKAVQTVVDHGYALPYDLRFYCSNVLGTLTQAFKRGDNWMPIAYIVLGDGGSTKALSSTAAGFNGFETRTIRTIHEIGHILHERMEGDGFWEKGRTPNGAISAKVSVYGCCNEKEFVAEVFTGVMIGKQWPADVMAEYRKFGGPTR